jgi:8-oxo-dGTP pyrophosphatase MutT (NUDIX family)
VHGQKGKALSLQSLKEKLKSEFTQLLKNEAFSEQFVEFCATKNSDLTLQLPSNNKLNELFNGLVGKALDKGCNPSAAAQFIVKVNDNGQEKFVLLVSTSARRGDLIQASNGALEKGESLGGALQREAMEELNLNGLPGNFVTKLLMQKPTGMRLGGDITYINAVAKKIALGKFLYLNVATVFSNDKAISLEVLKPMVAELNQRFKQTNPFYQQAVDFVFGAKKTEFNIALNLEIDPLQPTIPEEHALAAPTKTNAQYLVQCFLDNIRCKGVITPAQFKNVLNSTKLLGATETLHKPIDLKLLVETVSKTLKIMPEAAAAATAPKAKK